MDLQDMVPGIYSDVPEVLRELFHRLPFDKPITLANGRTGRFVKLAEPRERDGRWEFALDFRFDSGSPDHLEFYLKHTGGGGFVAPGNAPPPQQKGREG